MVCNRASVWLPWASGSQTAFVEEGSVPPPHNFTVLYEGTSRTASASEFASNAAPGFGCSLHRAGAGTWERVPFSHTCYSAPCRSGPVLVAAQNTLSFSVLKKFGAFSILL